MGLIEAILLGCLQGLTEFLPVSSSAHLVAAQSLLGVNRPGISLEVCAHLGTLLAILFVFGRALARTLADGFKGAVIYLRGEGPDAVRAKAPLFPTALAVAVGSIPAACVGALFERHIERSFESLPTAGYLLVVTGLILLASRFAPRPKVSRVGPGRGFLVGLAQALALLPGISRSGTTIVTGCLLGVERSSSARFSFILACPALAGAAAWKLWRGWASAPGGAWATAPPEALPLIAVVAASALTGTACLLLLLRVVERGRLYWFAAYCLPAGVVMAAAGLWNG